MKNLFRCAALAPLLALAAGCCANNECNCDDLQADSLFLVLANNRVNADTVNISFTRAELDTVYLRRYSPYRPANNDTKPPTPAQPEGALSDPVSIVRAQQTIVNSALLRKLGKAQLDPKTTIVISNLAPFAPSTTGGKLDAYNYVLTIQDRSTRTRPSYEFTLKNINLQGRYEADGCCTCYENSQKRFTLSGRKARTIDVTESGTGADKAPVPVLISKLD